MKHPAALGICLVTGCTRRQVAAHFPVEGHLQGVLDRQGSAGNEKEVGQVVGNAHPRHDIDQPGHLDRIQIGVAGFVDRHPADSFHEFGRGEVGMVGPEGGRGEIGEEIQILCAVSGVTDDEGRAVLQIENQRVPIHQHVFG